MLDPTLIGQALLALLVVASTLTAKWSTQARAQRREIIRTRKTVVLFESYTFELTRTLAHNGITVPDPPPGLYEQPEGEES